ASLVVTLGVTVLQQVQVQDVVQGIDTEKSDVSQVIDTPKIADLPVSGRDFIDFVLLTPSVNVGRSTAVGAQSPFTETVLKLSFGGVRESHTSFFDLDGIYCSTSISRVQLISPLQPLALQPVRRHLRRPDSQREKLLFPRIRRAEARGVTAVFIFHPALHQHGGLSGASG